MNLMPKLRYFRVLAGLELIILLSLMGVLISLFIANLEDFVKKKFNLLPCAVA